MRDRFGHDRPRAARLSRRLRRAMVAVPAVLVLIGGVLTGFAATASAHGSTIDPPSRNYGCNFRWEANFQDPKMATQDPMCYQAWKTNPNAMYNWNGLYQDNDKGQFQKAVPDGSLCSGGHVNNGRYDALDVPGNWLAKPEATDFTLTFRDEARHGADYYRIYVSKQGFDPTRQRLKWSDLDLVKTTGKFVPGVGTTATADPKLDGVSVSIPVSAPGRTGRHIVFVLWQASHADQSYFICSDVRFPGGPPDSAVSGGSVAVPNAATGPTSAGKNSGKDSGKKAPSTGATPTPPGTATTPATATAAGIPIASTALQPASNAPSAAPAASGAAPLEVSSASRSMGCRVAYQVVNQWSNGHFAQVTVTNGATAATGWDVSWARGQGQILNHVWNGAARVESGTQFVSSTSSNRSLAAGAATVFWVIALGPPPAPGVLTCQGATG